MKHLTAVSMIVFLLLSCKKEINPVLQHDSIQDSFFFRKVKTQLKDSLSPIDYSMIDTDHLFKSEDAQSKNYFVRVAFQDKKIANDFLLLRTDSTGIIYQGKIIHVNDSLEKGVTNHSQLNGQFLIESLDRKIVVTKQVLGGRWKKSSGENVVQEEPAGEQDLPPVVVTSFSNDGNDTGDWYWYGGFFNNTNGAGTSYTYGYAGGGGSSAGMGNDNTIIIDVEPNEDPPIKIEEYIKCFNNIPNANANYSITIYSDIPVNGDPTKIFDWTTNSPGHSFIQLNKANGNQTVQQYLGFYPEHGWKAASNVSVDSKIVDNAGHEYNASLSQVINAAQFEAALNRIQAIASNDYNITTWNCTDFALSVFNAASSVHLTVPQFAIPTSLYPIPNNLTFSNTPEGLFEQIQTLQATHNSAYGTTNISNKSQYVGNSHGSCK